MSSHHIVKDKQEPALLILDLQQIVPEYLGQLLEWSPTVLVTDEMYEHADSLGIKIDAVITSGLSFSSQPATRIIPAGKNELLETGLEFLVGEHYPSVNVLSDDADPLRLAPFVNRINLVWYTVDKKIFPVSPGFSKWQVKGETVELLGDPTGLKTTGLVAKDPGVFETLGDGFYSLEFPSPFIFVAEKL